MVRIAVTMVFGKATAKANISMAHIQQFKKPNGWILTRQCNPTDQLFAPDWIIRLSSNYFILVIFDRKLNAWTQLPHLEAQTSKPSKNQ
jgi:hypothetical protein